jgi:hypothetical protein
MMKFVFGLILIAAVLSPLNQAEDYQRRIFYYLNNEYFPQPLPEQFGYDDLYRYLEQLNETSPEFAGFKDTREWQLALSEQNEIRRITINHIAFETQPLPLYPMAENDRAIIAAFKDTYSDGYLRLSEDLQRFCREHRTDAWPDPAKVHPPVTVDYVRGAFPTFTAIPFWLVSEKKAVKVEPASLTLTQDNSKVYRLELKISGAIKNPMFLFQAESMEEVPRVMKAKVNSRKFPPVLDREKIFAVPVNDTGDLLYIGPLVSTNSSFDLLWDSKARSIVYLAVVAGRLGNFESRDLSRNYPLALNQRRYILRMAENRKYAELIYIQDTHLKKTVLFN